MDNTYFGIIDVIIFTLSVSISISIGIYFAFCGRKQNTENEYLYGNKTMQAIPVGLSIYSSAMSAITIIGIPSEVYYFGTGYMTCAVGIIIAIFVIWAIFLPVFCGNLNIKTPYEYFERRFSNNVKLMSSFIYIIHTLLLMPVVLYASSLALSQVTKIPILICTTAIGGVCILYTTFGGFRTVIWTDTIQATLMLFSCLLVAITGICNAGGVQKVWESALEGNRINFFNMDPNPFTRITFWTVTIGITFIHLSHSGCSASALQRYMSLPSLNQAKISTVIGAVGVISMTLISGITGLAMYAIYKKCDPYKNNDIGSPNQIVPYFVTQTLNYIPGFSGFFVAGLLSAGLSTLSSELNVVGGIIYYDIIRKFFKNKFTETRGIIIMKLIIIVNGIIYLITVSFLLNSKYIYELSLMIAGVTYGAKLGIILLGILFPKTNSKGVISGAIVSILFVSWINFNAHHYNVTSYYKLETSTENCSRVFNETTTEITLFPTLDPTLLTTTFSEISNFTENSPPDKIKLEDIFILYKISYLYYCLIGTIITIAVGNVVSYFTGWNNLREIDPLLVAPFLRSYVKSQQKPEIELYLNEQQ